MTFIIGIHGLKRSGKTTATEIIQTFLTQRGRTVEVIAFADVLKDALGVLFGFSREFIEENKETEIQQLQEYTPRDLMCSLGDWVRNIHPDSLQHSVTRKIDSLEPNVDFVIISDIRLDSEAEFIRRQLKGLIIKIDASIRLAHVTSPSTTATHMTEHGVHDKHVDYLIYNNRDIKAFTNELETFLETCVI